MTTDPLAALGALLTGAEAQRLATLLLGGQHVQTAVNGSVSSARRGEVRSLLDAAGLGHQEPETSSKVLRAIAGAKEALHDVTPVWTMPGNEAKTGHLTGEFHRLVASARTSVVCATYNFEPTSQMWNELRDASGRPGMTVCVYVDGTKADGVKVKGQLPKAVVYTSAALAGGRRIVSHAKFVIIDHEMLLLTSANFSYSAEQTNIEFGLLVHDSALARSIEETMTSKHGTLYSLA